MSEEDVSMQPIIDRFTNRYYDVLASEAAKRKTVGMVIGNVDFMEDYVLEDDDIDETAEQSADSAANKSRCERRCIQFLKDMPYVFITHNARRNFGRLKEALGMVGCDTWKDTCRFTNTASAPEFQRIYAADLHFCADLLREQKYTLAAEVLIGVVLALDYCPHGFWDTDMHDEALAVLDRFMLVNECDRGVCHGW